MVATQGTLQHVALVKSPLILEQWEGKSHRLDLLDHLAVSLPGLKPLAVGVLCVCGGCTLTAYHLNHSLNSPQMIVPL